MADYYDVESKGNGRYTITPRENPGCLSVIVVFILILVFGFIIACCDSESGNSSPSSHTSQTPQQTTQETDSGYIWLTDLSPINYERLYTQSYYDTTSNVGTELTHCLRTGTMSYGGPGEGWIEYYLDGGYKYLTGYLAITQEFLDTEYIGNLIIYADGKEIYRVDKMIAGDAPVYFQLDVSDVQRVRIEHMGGEPFRVADLKLWIRTPTKG